MKDRAKALDFSGEVMQVLETFAELNERYPSLGQLFGGYLNQDWSVHHKTAERPSMRLRPKA